VSTDTGTDDGTALLTSTAISAVPASVLASQHVLDRSGERQMAVVAVCNILCMRSITIQGTALD